jgi:phage I-like protein
MARSQVIVPFAACALKLGSASREIQLLPAGEFTALDGRPHDVASWKFDADQAQQWIAALRQRRTPFVIDYEHQTLQTADNGKPAPAAGWFTAAGLEIRNGELWATDVEWTAAAKAAIEANEYRFISPVFKYDKSSGVITGLVNAALTNSPAIDGMEQVLRAAANQFANHQETDVDPKELRKALGLSEDASDQDVLAACAQLVSERDELKTGNADLETQLAAANQQLEDTGNPDPAKFAPIQVVNDLRDQVVALSQQVTGDQVDALVTAALSDGRLLPAQKDWATDLGKKDIAALNAYLETATPIVGLRQRQSEADAQREAAASEHGLTVDQLAICNSLGQDPAEYAKSLKALEEESSCR